MSTNVSSVAIVLPAATSVTPPIHSAVFSCEDYEKCVLTQMQEVHGRMDLMTPEKVRQQAIVALIKLVDSRNAPR